MLPSSLDEAQDRSTSKRPRIASVGALGRSPTGVRPFREADFAQRLGQMNVAPG